MFVDPFSTWFRPPTVDEMIREAGILNGRRVTVTVGNNLNQPIHDFLNAAPMTTPPPDWREVGVISREQAPWWEALPNADVPLPSRLKELSDQSGMDDSANCFLSSLQEEFARKPVAIRRQTEDIPAEQIFAQTIQDFTASFPCKIGRLQFADARSLARSSNSARGGAWDTYVKAFIGRQQVKEETIRANVLEKFKVFLLTTPP
jgi:hypothetical protein